MPRIRTTDAKTALDQQLTEEAKTAAGGNALVSKTEAKGLDPFVKRAEEALRREGGKGTRVTVGDLVERAAKDAVAGWEQFNPPGHGTDSTFLAKAELADIRKADPQLGALTDRALLRLGKLPAVDLGVAVKTFFSTFDFSDHRLSSGDLLGGARVDARVGQPGRAGVPAAVLDVFDYYYRAEAGDWASVSLQKGTIAGQDVWVTYMTTDGDDEYLEVLDRDGKAVASAHLLAGTALTWDPWPGRVRLSAPLAGMNEPRHDEGLSEPDDAIARGQIPPNRAWQGTVELTSGFVHHQGGRITGVDLPAGLAPELRDAAILAFDVLWDRLFSYQGHDTDIELGMRRAGTMALGTFTRPDDGKTYIVADWRDIDDSSFTFYFTPGPAAPILAIEQFNN